MIISLLSFFIFLISFITSTKDCKNPNGEDWYDSYGPTYNCEWYSQSEMYCEGDGNSYENFGMTANQACVACGGGEPNCNNYETCPLGYTHSMYNVGSNDNCANSLFETHGGQLECSWMCNLISHCNIFEVHRFNYYATSCKIYTNCLLDAHNQSAHWITCIKDPTPTATNTATDSLSATVTGSITSTNTATDSLSFTIAPTSSITATDSLSFTVTPINSITATYSLSFIVTPTGSMTATDSLSFTVTPINSMTATNTATYSLSFTITPTNSLSFTVTPTSSMTATNRITATAIPTLTSTSTNTNTITKSYNNNSFNHTITGASIGSTVFASLICYYCYKKKRLVRAQNVTGSRISGDNIMIADPIVEIQL